ncbi:MAG: hypothetical protein JO142_16490 [Burkholderiales bacterium]|nr:hypothetical protein [Burkholderiales bacterium]
MLMAQASAAARRIAKWAVLGTVALVAACGGPGGSSGSNGTPTGTPVMTLTISSSSISPSQNATVSAKIVDGSGNAVSGTLVTFTTTSGFGSFSPAAGTALTDSTGTAKVTLLAGTTSGAAQVTASASVTTSTGSVAVTQSVGYVVSATSTTLGLTPITFGTSPLSAYGTTSVSVTVQGTSNGTTSTFQAPVTVNFNSVCASAKNINGQPLANLTSSVTSVNGVASAQYVDNGCNSTDVVTATISNVAGVSVTGSLPVQTPALGSIQFVSVNPKTITLAGTGGQGLGQTSTVVFRVLDSGGNPIQATVQFALNTTVGGVNLTNSSAIADPKSGLVQTIVNAGTIPTPVRVTATINGTTLASQSDVLSVSTGLPDQSHFSASAGAHNIEGFNRDGTTTNITIRLADHFGNPIPDGTAVNLISSVGSVQPQCTTSGGACTVTVTSQNPRTSNGRGSILAYAVGESCFTDLNGNGLYDGTNELVDVNGKTCDLGEAYLDAHQTGAFVSGDQFIDFNQNGKWDTGDGLYHGSLCSAAAESASLCCRLQTISAGQCTIPGYKASRSVYQNIPMTFSSSGANATVAPLVNGTIKVGQCGTVTENLTIADVNGNEMAAGTTVTLSTTKGTVTPSSYTVLDNPGTASTGAIVIKDDGTTTAGGGCTPSTNFSGLLTILVTAPASGTKSTFLYTVTN